jgi:hypothetical protein
VAPGSELDITPDPLAVLDCELELLWTDIRDTYDVAGPLPELPALFAGANMRDADAAAEMVLVNMLLEVMERVSRFSPWYTRPASAYGLERVSNRATGQVTWRLQVGVKRHCHSLLERLSRAISNSRSLLQVFILVDDFLDGTHVDEEAVLCRCRCSPPRYIWLPQCVVQQGEAVCDTCCTPFSAVDHT